MKRSFNSCTPWAIHGVSQFITRRVNSLSHLQQQITFVLAGQALLFAIAKKVTKNALLLVYKLKLEIIYTYNIALLYAFFSQSIYDTAGNKHSLEILQ